MKDGTTHHVAECEIEIDSIDHKRPDSVKISGCDGNTIVTN